MSAHKYQVGQTVPFCFVSRNIKSYGTAEILEKSHIAGYIVKIVKDIDTDNERLNQNHLLESEIDRGYIKFKKRKL
jgi:hypothetical protein